MRRIYGTVEEERKLLGIMLILDSLFVVGLAWVVGWILVAIVGIPLTRWNLLLGLLPTLALLILGALTAYRYFMAVADLYIKENGSITYMNVSPLKHRISDVHFAAMSVSAITARGGFVHVKHSLGTVTVMRIEHQVPVLIKALKDLNPEITVSIGAAPWWTSLFGR